MSAVKRQYQELTMNGKPLSVYANPQTAERDLITMREGDERDGYGDMGNVFFIKEMRIDYTTYDNDTPT